MEKKSIGVLAGFAPDIDGKAQGFRFLGKVNESHSYWEGETAK